MTNKEFKQRLTTPKTFKDVEEEKEYLFEIVQYWLKEYSPAIHFSQQLYTGKVEEIGWIKDMPLIRGGNNELELLRYAFDSIKKNTTFAD